MNNKAPFVLTLLSLGLVSGVAGAHSVAQVQTAKRISPVTVVALDPQGNPVPGSLGTDTKAKVGDVLSYIIRFTPVPSSATRGAGGYITEYVPANTEVVGARFLDANGNTVFPHRCGMMDDGWGPSGKHSEYDALGLLQGSLAQLYGDTGIFFSTDPRTARTPADTFVTVQNGLVIDPFPTGGNQLDTQLGFNGPPFYAHNEWDLLQTLAFGVNPGVVSLNGQGNTPFGFGSPVAGPDTFYAFEKVLAPKCSDGMDNDGDGNMDYPADAECKSALDDDETVTADGPIGPWQRIRMTGSEIGTGAPVNCSSCAGEYVRRGVPTSAGWDLSADNPLPAGTNAVRFAVGELVVGEEYLAEVSLRIKEFPLDPSMNMDVNCSEVFGGDAAQPQSGKDNAWRYYVASPSCVSLNLQFDLDVDKILAVQGEKLVYTLKGKNLSVNPQTNVVISDAFNSGHVQFNSILMGPMPNIGGSLLTWPAMDLEPGEEFTFQWDVNVTGNTLTTLNRAKFLSTDLPDPGFSVVAMTTIRALAVIKQSAQVTTNPATDPPKTTAGQAVHVAATLANVGTGDATTNAASFLRLRLPPGFTYCPPPTCAAAKINGVDVPDPAIAGDVLTFTTGLATVPKGGALTLDADINVGAGVLPGLYTFGVQSRLYDAGITRDVETENLGVAPLLVGIDRSDPPALSTPVFATAKKITGVTSEGPGATVTVFVNGNPAPSVVAGPGGAFVANVPTLFAGQHLYATAKSAGEIESVPSSPDVVVQGLSEITSCFDGMDNDGDGLTDFPDDPGCKGPLDPDEVDTPQCSDGVDNDGDGATDYPDDASCSSYVDTDESGPPACSDGVDNDGDGQSDFPEDPDCQAADDPSELTASACSDGVDNDGDGLADYPLDPGCEGSFDDDEVDMSGTGGAGGAGGTGGVGGAGGTGGTGGIGGGNVGGGPPDPGGIEPTGGNGGGGGGCGCRTSGPGDLSGAVAAAAAIAVVLSRRRRRSAGVKA